MNEILESISRLLRDPALLWLTPLLALGAGVVTSLMPCSLASIPLVIGFVSGSTGEEQKDKRRPLKLSLTFALGMTITFTLLGVIVATVGGMLGFAQKWVYLVLGVLMILMALQTWEIFEFIPSSYLISRSNRRGYLGALIAGALGGLFSSPCSTPVLIVLLGLVAAQGEVFRGVLLLALYAAGHSVLSVLAGTSAGFAKRITQSGRYGRLSLILKIVMGTLILLMGLYLLYLGF